MGESKSQSIALFQTAFLGDVLLTLPSLYRIKNHFPHAHITYFCLNSWKEILSCYPFIDEVIGLEKSEYRQFFQWRERMKHAQKFDWVLTAHRSLSSQLANLLIPAKNRVAFGSTPLSYFFKHRVKYNQSEPEIQRVSRLLEPLQIQKLDIPYDTRLPRFFSTEVNQWFYNLKLAPRSYTVIAPGSRWATKRWPINRYVELATHLKKRGHTVLWTGTSEEIPGSELIEDRLNFIDKTSLPQWLCLLVHSRMIICNDSAATHIGTLHQIPTVTIFGPTTPSLGYGPTHPHSQVVEPIMHCRPCTIHGSNQCPLGHHDCMNKLEPREVLKRCEELVTSN